MTRIALGIVTLGVLGIVLYPLRPHTDQSPLRLLGLAPGMSRREMRRIVERAPGGSVNCAEPVGRFRNCQIQLPASGGFATVLLDPRGRVAVVQLQQPQRLDSLAGEAERARPQWDAAAQRGSAVPQISAGDTGVARWVTADRRWSAEMHFLGAFYPDVPVMLIVADERALAELVAESPQTAEYAKRHQLIDPTPDEAEAAFAQRQSERSQEWTDARWALIMLGDQQTAYHNEHGAYASQLQQLTGLFILGATQLAILSATDSGWVGEARHPRFPGRSCVIYNGKVDALPQTAQGVAITHINGIACDEVAPEARPSLGQQ